MSKQKDKKQIPKIKTVKRRKRSKKPQIKWKESS
jgi:hypothetical protein